MMTSHLRKIWYYFLRKLMGLFQFIKFVLIPKSRWGKISLISVFFLLFIAAPIAQASIPSLAEIGDYILYGVNWLFFQLASALGWIAMKIFALVILVSAWNDFVDVPAVTKAWVLVRDVCNLFFVLALLVIAFEVILQVKKHDPVKNLYVLIVAAILVNFSKLICALLIDFGQVVMMTFVNGYSATAGANLVNGMGLTKMMQLSDLKTFGDGQGVATDAKNVPDNSQLFLMIFIAIFMLIMIIMVTFFILVLLFLRIAQLWLLIATAPLAFVLEAIPVGGMKSKASDWWKKFGWTVAVGPIMAFFLWMSLLVMSTAGDTDSPIKKNFDATAIEAKSSAKGGPVSKFSVVGQMAQTAIGLAMLLASLEYAQEAGGMVGGAAGKMKDTAGKTAKFLGKKMTGLDKAENLAKGFAKPFIASEQKSQAKWQGRGEKAGTKVTAGIGKVKSVLGGSAAAGAGAVIGSTVSGAKEGIKGGWKGMKEKAKSARQKAKEGGGGIGKQLLAMAGGGIVGGAIGTVKGTGKGIVEGGKSGAKKGWKTGRKAGSIEQEIAQENNDKFDKEKRQKRKGELKRFGVEGVDELKEEFQNGKSGMSVEAGLQLAEQGEIDNFEDADRLMNMKGISKDDKRRALQSIAESMGKKGNLKDGDDYDRLMSMAGKDGAAQDGIKKVLKGSHAHLTNDLDTEAGQADFEKAVKQGRVRLSELSPEALEDEKVHELLKKGLGSERYHSQLEGATKDDPVKAEKAVAALLKQVSSDATPSKEKDSARRAIAGISKDLGKAFGGEVKDAEGNGTGEYKLDLAQDEDGYFSDETAQMIHYVNADNISDFDIDESNDDLLEALKDGLHSGDLGKMLKSGSGQDKKLAKKVLKLKVKQNDPERLADLASNNTVMGEDLGDVDGVSIKETLRSSGESYAEAKKIRPKAKVGVEVEYMVEGQSTPQRGTVSKDAKGGDEIEVNGAAVKLTDVRRVVEPPQEVVMAQAEGSSTPAPVEMPRKSTILAADGRSATDALQEMAAANVSGAAESLERLQQVVNDDDKYSRFRI